MNGRITDTFDLLTNVMVVNLGERLDEAGNLWRMLLNKSGAGKIFHNSMESGFKTANNSGWSALQLKFTRVPYNPMKKKWKKSSTRSQNV